MAGTREYRSVIKVQADVSGMASLDKATAGLTTMGTVAAEINKELAAASGKSIKVNVNAEALTTVQARIKEVRASMAEALRLDVTADTAPAMAELRRLEAQQKALQKAMAVPIVPKVAGGAEVSKTAEGFADLRNEIFGLVGITPKLAKFVPVVAAAGLAIKSVEAGSDLTKLETQLTSLTGSVANMQTVISGVDQLSVTVPINQDDLEQASLALAKFGIAAGKIPPILGALSNVSIATGTPLADLAQKFGQLNAVGVTQSRTLTALAKSGIPIYQALAQSMGITVEQAQALAKQGSLTSQEIFGMVQALGQMDAGAAAAQAKSLHGELTILGNETKNVSEQLGQALAPVLTTLVGAFGYLVGAVTKIPTPLLAVATGVALLYAGMKTLGPALGKAVSNVVEFGKGLAALPAKLAATAAGMETVAVASEEVAAESAGALSVLGGPWGLVIAGAIGGLTLLSSVFGDTKDATESWTAALEYQNGVLTANNTQAILAHLQQSKLIDDANKLGISTKTLIEAYSGQADAVAQVNAKTAAAQSAAATANQQAASSTGVLSQAQKDQIDSAKAAGDAANALAKDFSSSTAAMSENAAQADAAQQAQQDLANSTGNVDQATQGAISSLNDYKTRMGELQTNVDDANTALQTMIQNMSILNGNTLDLRSAQRGLTSAQLDVTQAVKDYNTAVKDHGKRSDDAKRAALGVASALDAQATAANKLIQAQAENGSSADALTTSYNAQATALYNAARATGMSRDEAQKYVDTVLQTPAQVSTTFTAIGKGYDTLQQKTDDLAKNRSVTIDVNTHVDWTDYWKLVNRLNALGQSPLRGPTGGFAPSPGSFEPNSAPSAQPSAMAYSAVPVANVALPTQATLAAAPQVTVYLQDRKLAGLIDVQVRHAAGAGRLSAVRRRVIQV